MVKRNGLKRSVEQWKKGGLEKLFPPSEDVIAEAGGEGFRHMHNLHQSLLLLQTTVVSVKTADWP